MPVRDLQEQLDEQEQEQDDDIQIEVIDDRPEEDQKDPVDLEALEDDDDDADLTDEEIEALGARAQKRIKKLTFKYHETRRQKEQAERERQEALEAARRAMELSQNQGQSISAYQGALIERQEKINESDLRDAKSALARATEEGNAEAIADAQQALTEAVMRSRALDDAKRTMESRRAQPEQQSDEIQQIAQREPTPQAQQWAEKNPWFNTNKRMTSYAYGVHEELVMSGVQPDTAEYYQKIDQEMHKRFPEEFGNTSQPEPPAPSGDVDVDISPNTKTRANTVAPTGRTSGRTGKAGKVRLTRTQVETAKKLGVPLREYAKQVLIEQEKNR